MKNLNLEQFFLVEKSIEALEDYKENLVQELISKKNNQKEIQKIVEHLQTIQESIGFFEKGIELVVDLEKFFLVEKSIEALEDYKENFSSEIDFKDTGFKLETDIPTLPTDMRKDSTQVKDHWERISNYILNYLRTSSGIVSEIADTAITQGFFKKTTADIDDLRAAFGSRMRRLKESQYVINKRRGREYSLTDAGKFFMKTQNALYRNPKKSCPTPSETFTTS
jgi:hypothetical protein